MAQWLPWGALGVSRWSRVRPSRDFPRGGRVQAAKNKVLPGIPFCFLLFPRQKLGNTWCQLHGLCLVKSQGAAGAPQPSLCAKSGLCFIYFCLRMEQSFICSCGEALHTTEVIPFFFFCEENECLMAAPSTGTELISGIFMCGL